MAPARVDPELAAVFAAMPKDDAAPSLAGPLDIATIRTNFATMIQGSYGSREYPAGMRETVHTTPSVDGSTLRITQFVPRELVDVAGESGQRAVIYLFGGGTIAGSVELCRNDIAIKAAASQTQYFAVHYRLAPEHPYPAAMHDVWSAVRWLQARGPELGVDPARLVLAGMSAGSLFAAGVSLYARDQRLSPPIAGMLLMYPMLDDRTTLADDDPIRPYLTVTPEFMDLAWRSYLGGGRALAERTGDNTPPAYAVPARAADLAGLPRAYIDIGGLDLFRDETLAFASRLAAASVEVELHLFSGVTHGFDAIPFLTASKTSAQLQKRFIESF
ncbi:acetyl esterase [Microdochium nivale]|nr:acetyl esterase [Microdochium nivale]